MNPYQELGVAREADEETIKAAFKRRARKTHPDKGGDTEEFKRVNTAYQILSDPTRKAHFDQHGTDAKPEVDPVIAAHQTIMQIIVGLIDARDVKHDDILHATRNHVEAEIARIETIERGNWKTIHKHEVALKRITRKAGGQNMIADMLQNRIDQMRQQVEGSKPVIAHLKFTLDVIDGYGYQVDEPGAPQFGTPLKADALRRFLYDGGLT